MLHSISWARFGAVIIIGLVIYYGYVLLSFYGRELRALVGGWKVGGNGISQGMAADNGGKVDGDGKSQPEAAVEKGFMVADGPNWAGGAASGAREETQGVGNRQGKIFPEAGVGETPELFKVMEKVILLLRQVVNEAAATGVRREEVEDRIRMVLSGYRQLVKTPYHVSINNFISRACTTTFSLQLSDREIEGLWGP